MKASELISQSDLNTMIGRRVFEVLQTGRIVFMEKGEVIDFNAPGLRPTAWDVVADPRRPGDVVRVKFEGTSSSGETVASWCS